MDQVIEGLLRSCNWFLNPYFKSFLEQDKGEIGKKKKDKGETKSYK